MSILCGLLIKIKNPERQADDAGGTGGDAHPDGERGPRRAGARARRRAARLRHGDERRQDRLQDARPQDGACHGRELNMKADV